MNILAYLGKIVEFTSKVNDFDCFELEEQCRAKILSIVKEDDCIKISFDFKEFAEYNKQFAKPRYFDKNLNPCLKFHETPYYNGCKFRQDLYVEDEKDFLEYCVILDNKQEQKELIDCLDFAKSNGYYLAAKKIQSLII